MNTPTTSRAPQRPQQPQLQPQPQQQPLTALQQMLVQRGPHYPSSANRTVNLPQGHPSHYPAPQQQMPQRLAALATDGRPAPAPQKQPQPATQLLLPSSNLRPPVRMAHSGALPDLDSHSCWGSVLQRVPVFVPGKGMVEMPLDIPVQIVRIPVQPQPASACRQAAAQPPQPPTEHQQPQPPSITSPGRQTQKRRLSATQDVFSQAIPPQPKQQPSNIADALRQVMAPTPAPQMPPPASPPHLKRVCPNIMSNGNPKEADLRKLPPKIPPLPNRMTKENNAIRMPQA